VVGGGIAGLGAAWLLRRHYQVQLFERNDYVGGHTNTRLVHETGQVLPVDTGFIVFNEANYPLLTGLFRHLGVASRASDMSFGVSLANSGLEYGGSSLATLFAQRRNLLRPAFLGMLRDILRFSQDCRWLLRQEASEMPLAEFLQQRGYGEAFRNHYLLPMAAAIWSCPLDTMMRFPAISLARFFDNHGLLDVSNRPQWRTLIGGSRSYVDRMLQDLGTAVHTNASVTSVVRSPRGVTLRSGDGARHEFDAVILAGHADETLAMLAAPTPLERRVLGAFHYQPNEAVLHTDTALMPRSRKVWSSWNYLADDDRSNGTRAVSVTYWMNRLQGLQGKRDYFVSLNPLRPPSPDSVIYRTQYQHPVFDLAALRAQVDLQQLQGRQRTFYCGSYTGYGFHEDGFRSAVQVAEMLGVALPWSATVAPSAVSETGPMRAPVFEGGTL